MSILFASDWAKFPRAIPDYKTKNESFLKMAILLNKMGIKNCLFPLALLQPELQGVDPHDVANLTDAQKTAILFEVQYNPWYFFREIVKIPPKAGSTPIDFRINRATLATYWLFFNHVRSYLILCRQVGKGLSLDAKVKTPGGWKRNGDITVGDVITAGDGTEAGVIGVYPQGMKPIYEFTFFDGRKVKCDDTHLWKVWDPLAVLEPGTRGGWRIMTTLEVIERRTALQAMKHNLYIPLPEPENMVDVDLPIHPYALGAFIGDGGLTSKTLSFTNVDEDVITRVNSVLPQDHEIARDVLTNKKHRVRYIAGKIPDYSLKQRFSDIGLLGKYSHEKFIPEMYLQASHEQRLELLRGLLDTDGTIGTNNAIEYSTASERLAMDVQYLVRSVGGICKVTSRIPHYTHNGERKAGRLAYRVKIRYSHPWELFHNARRKERAATALRNVKFNNKLSILDIKRVADEETLCIEIDHPDHLYVTDDFIVTHNTVGMSALVQGVMKFWANNTLFQQITKDTKLKLETIDTIKEIGSLLPSYLTSINVELDNPESKTEIKYSLKNNLFKSMVGRNDRKAANNLGRGATSPILWFDEPPFTPFIGETVPAALGSMSAAVEEAAKSGNPYGVVFTTTAGKIDDRDGGFIYGLVQAAAPWSEHMYDCRDRDDLISMIRMNMADSESAIAVNCTFTHNQLGYSDEWLKRKIAESSGSKEQADMDWRVIWASGGAYSPLTADQLEAIRQSEMEPTHTERTKDNYLIRWYDDPETHEENLQQGNYVLGIDSSEAVGRDAIAMVITDVRDLSVVGVATVNDTNLTRYAVWLCDLLIKYPKITGIIERKSSGVGILDHLLYVMQAKGIDPFKRLYNKLVDEQNLRVDEYKEVKGTALARRDAFFYDKFRRDFGFITDKKSRQELYRDVMAEAVRRGARKLRDKMLAGELKKLEIRKNRVDHPEGGHDDHVIAWLMTAWFLLNSRHHQVYGIPANAVFASITDNGGDITEEDRKLGERIEQLHEDMNEAFAELRRTENPYAIVQLEQRIRNLNAKIGQSGGVANNVDTLIQQAMFERRRKYLDRAKTPNYLGRWNG